MFVLASVSFAKDMKFSRVPAKALYCLPADGGNAADSRFHHIFTGLFEEDIPVSESKLRL